MALLHMLKAREDKDGFFLSAVNCEHGIRGADSLGDTRFVAEICALWGVPLFTFSADCPAEAKEKKLSLETAAREFRYRSFQSLLDEGKTDFVATAHHSDDTAETILFRLCRGTSLSGLRGIEPLRGGFLRPLLDWTKEELEAYVKRENVPFREDETNFETEATRNKLRLEILPSLERAVPAAKENLLRFARLAVEDDKLLYRLSDGFVEETAPEFFGDTGLRVKVSGDAPLMRRACLAALKRLGIERDYTAAGLYELRALGELQTGSRLPLPNGLTAERVYDKIVFFRTEERALSSAWKGEPFREGTFSVGRYVVTVSAVSVGKEKIKSRALSPTEDGVSVDGEKIQRRMLWLDADAVPATAVFRRRREGDSFEKFGGGRKTLKKYLVNKKIPEAVRAELPVLADEHGEVYAVCGVEIAERVRVTPDTVRVVCITIKNKR